MKAYTQGITKEQFVAEIKRHKRLDHFIQRTYSNGVKGCAIGCAVKSINRLTKLSYSCFDHSSLAQHLGIPEWLARLQDEIFEGVSVERSKVWPVEFVEAINEGSDLALIKLDFIAYILEFNLETVEKLPEAPYKQEVINSIKQMIEAQKSGDWELLKVAESAANLAARSARAVAGSAAGSAWSAAESVTESAWSAARSARAAAWSVAWAVAESAARGAVWTEELAVETGRAAKSARRTVLGEFAGKLLELIKACK